MSDEFNEDLLKEALNFDLDDSADDNNNGGYDIDMNMDIDGLGIKDLDFGDDTLTDYNNLNIDLNTANNNNYNQEQNNAEEGHQAAPPLPLVETKSIDINLIAKNENKIKQEPEQAISQLQKDLVEDIVQENKVDREAENREFQKMLDDNPSLFIQDNIDTNDYANIEGISILDNNSQDPYAIDSYLGFDLDVDINLEQLGIKYNFDDDFKIMDNEDSTTLQENVLEKTVSKGGDVIEDYSDLLSPVRANKQTNDNNKDISKILGAFGGIISQTSTETKEQAQSQKKSQQYVVDEANDDKFVPYKPIKLELNDEVVKAMRNDFSLKESEINKIVDSRFGNFEKDGDQKTIKQAVVQMLKTSSGVNGLQIGDESVNFQALLDLYDQMQNKQFTKIKQDRSQLRKAYFSSLQQGEWSEASDISPIEIIKHKVINEMLDTNCTSKVTCFAMSIFTQRLFLAGTKTGEIVEYDLNTSKVRKYQANGEILTIDICRDDSIWAAGTSKSEIVIRKSLGGWSKKIITDFNHRPIIQIRFLSKSCMLVATDRNVTKFKIKDLQVTYELNYEPVTFEATEIVQIMYMPMPDIPGNFLAITASLNKVELTLLEPAPKLVSFIVRPDYIEEGWQPIVSWMIHVEKNFAYVIVFWKNFILLLKNDGEEFVICGQKQLTVNLVWGTVLSNRIVCMVDENYNMELRSVEYLFASFASGGGFGGSHQLPKDRMADTRIICTRADGSETKSSHERVRSLGNSIGFLTKDGLVKARLLTIRELSDIYIDRGKWLPALRFCVEVFKGKIISSKPEKDELHAKTPIYTINYIKNFLKGDKSNKKLMSSIARVSIEVLVETEHITTIFTSIMDLLDSIVFWKEIENFVLNGKIDSIPTQALEKGSVYLNRQAIQILMLNMNIPELLSEEEAFHQILTLVKKRKLWESFSYIAINAPEVSLKMLLTTMLYDQIVLPQEDKTKVQIMIKDKSQLQEFTSKLQQTDINEQDVSEKQETLQKSMEQFMGINSWLWKLVNWKQLNDLIQNQEGINEVKLRNWECMIEWLFEDQNLCMLGEGCIQILMEICFDLFMNHEVVLIHEARYKLLLDKNWAQLVQKKMTQDGIKPWYPIQKPLAESRSRASTNISQQLVNFDSSTLTSEPDLITETPKAINELPTEVVETSSSEELFLNEEKEANQNYQAEYIQDSRLCKIILLLIEHNLIEQPASKSVVTLVNFSFLFIRILNMSMFSHLFQDKEWIAHHLKILLKYEFDQNNFWMYYRIANKGDVEEQVVRVLKKAQFEINIIEEMTTLCQNSGYDRVFACLVDFNQGPLEGLKVHIKNALKPDQEGNQYIFTWLTNQFELLKSNTRELCQFSEEVVKYLPELISINKIKAKDVIMKLPSVDTNSEAIQILECYPDLQMYYIQNILEKELVDKEIHIKKELRLHFFRLKCAHEPESIVKILSTYNFPLEESLQICKELNNHHALAHIYYRLGLTEDAVDVYLSIIKNSLKGYLNTKEGTDTMKRIISDAQFSFQMVLEICLSMAKNENMESHRYFNKFINFIIESYLILGNVDQYNDANLETIVKVYELNTYIKISFVEKLLIYYAQALGTNEIMKMISDNKNMKSLKLKDYRGVLQFLGFERKIMADIDFVCRSGYREEKEFFYKKQCRGGIKSNKCSITEEPIKRDAIIFDCSHPTDVLTAKTCCKYPKDFICVRCPEKKFIEKALMTNNSKLVQTEMSQLAMVSMQNELERNKPPCSMELEMGFLNSEIFDFNTNQTMLDMYKSIMQDDIYDDILIK